MKEKLFVSLAVVAACSSTFAVSFSDGTFNNSDWSMVALPIGGTAQTGAQQATGGNPGSFRMVSTFSNTFTYMANLRTGYTYDPSVSGAITSLGWGIDTKNFNVFGQGMGYGLVMEQGGIFYGGTHFITGSVDFNWNSYAYLGLTAANFNVNIFSPGSPNFASGGPISFGFFTSNGNATGINVGYDNFHVEIETVPEPASIVALGFGAIILVRRRRV